MFQQAYAGVIDIDGDGRIDTSFNPRAIYSGYFDSYSCYKYVGNVNRAGDPEGYFQRSGPTIEDEDQTTLDTKRDNALNNVLSNQIPAARSVAGICQSEHAGFGGEFSGNWLNFLTTSKMDVIRKVLYGGTRKVDKLDETILEGSLVTRDSNTWGADVLSDDRWFSETPLNAYYDISKYTPFPKPASGKGHFFARVKNTYAYKSDHFAAFEYILNADQSIFQRTYTGLNGRFYDWVLSESPNPSTEYALKTTVNSSVGTERVIRAYGVKVKVCEKNNIGAGEECRKYPNGDVKPVGLLQKNGENGEMYFGLLSGSYAEDTRIKGGVLRNHIDHINKAVDLTTGQIKKGGLIWALDTFRLSGAVVVNNTGQQYANNSSWGNPIGEMLYEGVRYFIRLSGKSNAASIGPTSAFVPASEVNYNAYNNIPAANSGNNAEYKKNWKDIPDLSAGGDCSKPIILLISEKYSDYDGNDAVNASTNDLKMDVLRGITDPSPLTNYNMDTYLQRITTWEGLNNGQLLLYSTKPTANQLDDDCRPKKLKSLSEVNGLCPYGPAFEGTYSAAAVAYFAHTHNFGVGDREQSLDIYTVTMSPTYPTLDFPIIDSSGQVIKKISILPGSVTSQKKIFSFINYYIENWWVDKKGMPYHVSIRVNFQDTDKGGGGDWDMDAMVEYTVDLLTTASSPNRDLNKEFDFANNSRASGALKLKGGIYYGFKSQGADGFDIPTSEVVGLAIRSWRFRARTGGSMSMGYSIFGSTHDGTYMDVGHNYGMSLYATPPTCHWLKGYGEDSATDKGEKCNQAFSNAWGQYDVSDPISEANIRTFEFSNNPDSAGDYIEAPLLLAAKYGGFKDNNSNGLPDRGEWEGPDGLPNNYFQADNISELPTKLEEAFRNIAKSVSTGTSTSASINSVLSGGISIQTAFYPTFVSPSDPNKTVNWVGTVYALFVDKYGNLRENDSETGENYLGSDNSVLTFNNVLSPPDPPPACYIQGNSISRCKIDLKGEIIEDVILDQPNNIHQIKAIWDVGRYLSEHSPETRNIYYISPNIDEAFPFNEDSETAIELNKYMLHDNYASVLYPTTTAPAKLEATKRLIRYIRGYDYPEFRSRQMDNPWGYSPPEITWRLGDIINSKPVIVGQPPFNYDYIYNDRTYSAFKAAKATRRQVAYFGSNDGFLHAVNMGKFGSLLEGQAGYDPADKDLGQELWALIPDAALPHLQWLADLAYSHSYYVDMKPLIADIYFGGNDWRTILICGLRLGGRPIESPESTTSSPKNFYSEVFALDVTDPDAAPKVLWRFSSLELGLSVGLPTVVTSNGEWYAVLPSGPATDKVDSQGKLEVSSVSPYKGNSSQRARLFILNAKTGEHLKTLVVEEEGAENSFFNDPFVPLPLKGGQDGVWHDEVIYYGLTISRDGDCLDKGGVYRLQMVSAADDDPDTTDGLPLSLSQWSLKPFISVDRPVTGAVNSAFDYQGNLWVFFGTGRLWSEADLSPCAKSATLACRENHEQYIFGVKEELKNGLLTFKTQKVEDLLDVSNGLVYKSEDVAGLPDFGRVAYEYLTNYLATSNKAGYKRKLNLGSFLLNQNLSEIALTQPQVTSLGAGRSVLALTTYAPGGSACGDTGQGFMYVVDPFTGLAAPYLAKMFKLVTQSGGVTSQATGGESAEELIIPGGASTGDGQPSAAVLVQAGGSLIVRATTTANATIDGKVSTDEMVTNAIVSWREVFNTGFQLPKAIMSEGLLDPLP
ncbi:MAG: hypothetical protein LBR11_02575 [Deltaproteobacteria bacterium]|nr:hypothetical protein [Deltaproteobacteria bacterium]